jgi:hypothetical protein
MMAYVEIPTGQEFSDLGGLKSSGTVTRYRFVSVDADAGTLTIATSSAPNVGIATETATTGLPCGVKMSGVYRLAVDATAAISVGDYLKAHTAGVGYKSDANLELYNAVALEALASGTGTILVRIACGDRSKA